MSKKCTPLWRDAHFEVKMLKAPHVRVAFGRSDVSQQNVRVFMAFPKTMAGVGHFEEDLQRCNFCGRRRTRDMFISLSEMLGGPGADFLRGVAFWSIKSSVLGR